MKRQHYNFLDLVQYGVKRTFPGYGIVRMYSPHAFSMNMGRNDLKNHVTENINDEMKLLQKFFSKYPELKYMPILGPITTNALGQMNLSHPASKFVQKQQQLIKQGYTEHKAF